MSEEIQGNNDRQQQNINSETYKEENVQQAARTQPSTESSSTTHRAASPRAGARLVEAYGKLVGKPQYTASPDKVLLEYVKFLVSFVFQRAIFYSLFLSSSNMSVTLCTDHLHYRWCLSPLLSSYHSAGAINWKHKKN